MEWSPGSGLIISVAEGFGSAWLGGGISGLGGCRARRGRPRFLFKGGAETGTIQAIVRILLELQLDCLEMLVEVVSVVLGAPMDSTSEDSRDHSVLMEVK